MAKKSPLEIKAGCTVKAAPAEVYRMLTNSTHLREWLADVALASAHEGGQIYLRWNDGYAATGSFTRLEPGERVAFSWRGSEEPGVTQVDIEIASDQQGSKVSLLHSGFGEGKRSRKAAKDLRRAWASSMENLVSVMETGEDLRFTRRPMLGVSAQQEVDAERAAKLGLPVTHGIELSSVVPGMGAEAAGLRGGDVLVRVGGAEIFDWSALGAALQVHRAGDTIPVVFYRDGSEHRAEMTLSARPLPDVPATASALATYVRKLYSEFDAQLAACFEGVSEEAAGRKPAPDAWSAKEVLAHLLDGEGDGHSWITELVMGVERLYDTGFGNSDLRVAVTAWSYPTVAEMLAALRHLEEETLSILEQLPAEFVARKSSFWRLAYGYTQNDQHNHEHIEQIKAALAAG
jgi:uncharacterized protein YndB with AHSA1/START domain